MNSCIHTGLWCVRILIYKHKNARIVFDIKKIPQKILR